MIIHIPHSHTFDFLCVAANTIKRVKRKFLNKVNS